MRLMSPPREFNANVFAADGDLREGAADAKEHQGNARKIATTRGIGTAPAYPGGRVNDIHSRSGWLSESATGASRGAPGDMGGDGSRATACAPTSSCTGS